MELHINIVDEPEETYWMFRRLFLKEPSMSTLQQLLDAAQTQTGIVQSIVQKIDALRAQIAALPGITPEQQAQIDQAFQDIQNDNDALNAALQDPQPSA